MTAAEAVANDAAAAAAAGDILATLYTAISFVDWPHKRVMAASLLIPPA